MYLLARMFYNDGKVAIIAYSGIYAAGTFKWELVEMLVFAILLTPFPLSGGSRRLAGQPVRIQECYSDHNLCDRACDPGCCFLRRRSGFVPALRCRCGWKSLVITVFPDSAGSGLPWPVHDTCVFYHCCFCHQPFDDGPHCTGIDVKSVLGLYALSGSATAFLGHGMVTLFTAVSHSQSVGLGSAVILLGIGMLLMHWVREERAPDLV